MRALPCLVAIAILLSPDVARGQEARKVVLMLSEFRSDTQASIEREMIIRATLSESLREGLDYYAEFIDVTIPGAEYRMALQEFLRRKYEHIRFDAIIAVGQTAFEFARQNALFGGAPVVASTVDREAIEQTATGPPVTGVSRRMDPKGTIDFILSLQPQTKQIVVIGGGYFATPLRNLTEQEVRDSRLALPVDYLFDIPMEELLARVAALPSSSAILFTSLTEDGTGRRFMTTEAVALIRKAANGPVYGLVANQLEHGLIGGSLVDTNNMARDVAELTVQQVRLGKSGAVPIRERPSVPMANWRELQFWGLSEARLPVGTQVRYREFTVWERYRSFILGAASLIALQTMMIAALLIQRMRRRRAEQIILANEGALRASYERIQDLAGRLIAAQESERTRIARDLHDGLSQDVAGLAIGLSNLKRRRRGSEVEFQNALDALQQRTKALAQDIRQLSHDLHPGLLQHAGLAAALREHCGEFGRHHGIDTTLVAGDDLEGLDGEAALCLYRVAQEALRNISKHAGARHARVALARTDDILELTIADDGHGFDISRRYGEGAGLGLLSIDERVRLMKGTVKLESQLDRGTTLRVQVPLTPHEYVPQASLAG